VEIAYISSDAGSVLVELVPEKYFPTLCCRYVGVVANSVVEMDYQTLHFFASFVILFVRHFIWDVFSTL